MRSSNEFVGGGGFNECGIKKCKTIVKAKKWRVNLPFPSCPPFALSICKRKAAYSCDGESFRVRIIKFLGVLLEFS